MNQLVFTIQITLRGLDDPTCARPVIAVAAVAFRDMLGRASSFINTGGDSATAAFDKTMLQDAIDQIITG